MHVKSALSDTPAPGKSILVANAADFRNAIDKVACGDPICLQAGAEFAGNFNFPANSCDDAHWIVVRTSAADKDLPRREPDQSLLCRRRVPSRPAQIYLCSLGHSHRKDRLQQQRQRTDSFSEGANHYRFIGLEITAIHQASRSITWHCFRTTMAGDHIIFDRVWMHGGAQEETTPASCGRHPAYCRGGLLL